MKSSPEIVDYSARRERGASLHQEIMARPASPPTSPSSAALVDFVFAEIWSRPGLERRARRLVSLSCAADTGDVPSIAEHAYAALATEELDYDELLEAALHIAVYCGWPKAAAFERVVEEEWKRLHAERGSKPPARPEETLTSIAADQEQRKQDGEEEFRVVNCVPSPPRDVPYYDDGILNYVFGDMWKRPGLSRRDRRFITIACVAFDDTMIPIQSHVYSAMRSGDVSFEEMRELVLHFAAHSGWPKASFLQQTVDEMHQRVVTEQAEA
jgi:4-carboxymuconolactone decarboxylase